MGYTTEFCGTVSFNKPITPELKEFINKFSYIRHMTRDPEIIKQIDPDWEKHCFNGNLGLNGIYYYPPEQIAEDLVDRKFSWDKPDENKMINNQYGQLIDKSVTADAPASGVPSYWCQWIINDDDELEWDGGEKFYHYEEWLNFLIQHFFEPEGYILNGVIDFRGEDFYDCGTIYVKNNVVTLVEALEHATPECAEPEKANNENNLIKVPLSNGKYLIAEKNLDPDYKEIYIYVVDEENAVWQDLAIVEEAYDYDEDSNIIHHEGKYKVKVYADKDDEDWTNEFVIDEFYQEEDI